MKYVSGPYTQGQLLKEINEIETALTNRFEISGVITEAVEQRSWKERVEDASFGKNTVLYDDQGNPSVMVIFPLQTEADLVPGGANVAHPAFIVNGNTMPKIHIAKYQCFTVGSGSTLRAISLKHRDPRATITFDDSLLACKQNGAGWHLFTNPEWMAVSLWCKQQGFMPRGNNYYGKDHGVQSEKGIPSYFYSNNIARVASGSGPISWTHDGTPFGIYDMNGNVWEWVGGLRLNDGEIQVLENNNAADNTKDQSAGSAEWKAILQDGSIVAPGTVDTLKYDSVNAGTTGLVGPAQLDITIDNSNDPGSGDDGYTNNSFESLTADAGITVPNILKSLGLFPIDSSHGGDGFWARNYGERLPRRGGYWTSSSSAGVFALSLAAERPGSNVLGGFRSAFVNL